MFYFETRNNRKILKSDKLTQIDAFFTTRDGFDFGELNTERVLTPNQTHSDHIEIIDQRTSYPDTDGVILTKKGEAAYLRFADCTPLIFYDPVNEIAAISHAGWKGTAAKIGVKTLEKMHKEFNTQPQNVIALIGPAISLCCYEVGEDVKEKLLSTVKNRNGLFINNHVDLKAINSRQLEEFGVKNIDIAPYCTSCNNDLFFSYRKENGTKERHYAVVKL